MDFEDIEDKAPTQEFDVAQGREVGEYAVKSVATANLLMAIANQLARTAKFSNVSSLTLFFPQGQGAETIQIYYLGFLGHWTEVFLSSSTIHYQRLTIFPL